MDGDLSDDRIRRYLLGQLTEDERRRLETEFFDDDRIFDQLRVVETDLYDEYVTGALSGDSRRRFEKVFLTSREETRRVHLARTIQEANIVGAEMAYPQRPQVRESLWTRFGGKRAGLGRALAPAFGLSIVMVLVGWWLLAPRGRDAATLTLLDTSGAASVTGEGSARVAAVGPLPDDLSQAVRDLMMTGSVTPAAPVAVALSALPIDSTRNTPTPGQDPLKPRPAPAGPMFTAVRSTRPTLRWRAVTGAGDYQVLIADQERRPVWQGSAGAATEITVPDGVLQPGRAYLWQIEATTDEPRLGQTAGFWVMDDQTRREIEAIERTYQGSALILAAAYAKYGLYEDALLQAQRIAQLNPGRTEVQRLLDQLRQSGQP